MRYVMRLMGLLVLLLAVALPLLPAGAIDGVPTNQQGSITVSSVAVGFTSTVCKVGGVATGQDVPALVQVQTNGIYYRLNSSTATPVATDFNASAGDILEIAKPSLFRAIRSGSSDAALAYQCFER